MEYAILRKARSRFPGDAGFGHECLVDVFPLRGAVCRYRPPARPSEYQRLTDPSARLRIDY
jgi:hypothetical protein